MCAHVHVFVEKSVKDNALTKKNVSESRESVKETSDTDGTCSLLVKYVLIALCGFNVEVCFTDLQVLRLNPLKVCLR